MKVWVSVYLYDGLIYEMNAFGKKKEDAKKYFDKFVEDCGGLDEETELDYSNGEDGYFYFFDQNHNEIKIEEVDVK